MIEVFVGKVDNEVSGYKFKKCIHDIFGVQPFKVIVKLSDRKRFHPDLWPEGILLMKI